MRLTLGNRKERLRREAADWLTLLQSGRDPDRESRFHKWYSHPEHAAAFDRICDTHQKSGLLRQSPAYSATELESAPQPRRAAPNYALAAAAAVTLLVAGLLLLRINPLAPGQTDAVMLKTNIGEIRRVTLSDGSNVTLDTSTSVEVDLSPSQRKARVNYGRARFQVAAGEPFTVEAGSESVTARRGTLDVEHQGQQSRVDVLSGTSELHVSAADGDRQVTLSPREGALTNDGAPLQTYKLSATSDWTRGMLEFDGTPLSEVVAAANRYSDQHLVLDSEVGELGELRVSGAFRAGDNRSLARTLAAAFNLSVRQSPDANWHLSKTAGATAAH